MRRQTTHHQGKLPHQTIGILNARIGTARAKRRHLMRRVPHKQQTLVAKVFHAAALEGVNADPLQLKRALVAQHGLQTWQHTFRLFLFFRIGIPTQLKVDAPHVIGLLVQEHALPRVKRWVKPKPTLGRKLGLHHHVGDQEAVFEHMAFDVQAQHATHRAARAVAHNQPIGLDLKFTVRGGHAHTGMVIVRGDAHHLAFPPNVHAEL